MINFNISGAQDFKRLFGTPENRKNKILLQHLKTPGLLKWCREHNANDLVRARSMADLKQAAMYQIRISGAQSDLSHKVCLIGKTYWSAQYQTDRMAGLCEDFDQKAVRYVNVKSGHVYKMKAGKFFAAIARETEIGRVLSETTINWLAEEFSSDWQAYACSQSPEAELHVDDNFELIYNDLACRHFNSCSCMSGRNRYSFYEDSVEAKAAYLLDPDGYVLCRAILFTNVTDQDGKKWRLLERQYSRESNEVLKRLLIEMLIKGGYIDGYKQVGAGCSEARSFVANDDRSLSDKKFSIKCDLKTWQTLSYQDSFKFFDLDSKTAYNYPDAKFGYNLDTTDYNLDGDDDEEDYDEYHDYNCLETRFCYYHGSEIYVDVDNLDDFVRIPSTGEYHHFEDCAQCPSCGAWVVKEDAVYNPVAEGYFCDETCEEAYIDENFTYSEYDGRYYKNPGDVTTASVWEDESQRYVKVSISKETLSKLIETSRAFGSGQAWIITAETPALASA